jgi:HlyD family secretion protein
MKNLFGRLVQAQSFKTVQEKLLNLSGKRKKHGLPLAGRGANVQTTPPRTNAGTGIVRRRTSMARSTRGWSRAILWSLVGLTGFSAVYGATSKIESSITVQGSLEPIGGIRKVSAPLNSLVEEILVKEGDLVATGQPLIVLRDEAGNEQYQSLRNSQSMLQQALALVNTSLGLPVTSGMPDADPEELEVSLQESALRQETALSEVAQQQSSYSQAMAEQSSAERRLALNRSSHSRLEALVQGGAISKLQMEREEEKLMDAELNYERATHRLVQIQEQLRQSELRAAHVAAANDKELYSKRLNLERELQQIGNQIAEMRKRMDLHILKAPMAGSVFEIAVGKGELASPAQAAIQIVARDQLEAKIMIPNREAGLIKEGMDVEIRIDAYPFNEYGSIEGELIRIGASARKPAPGQPPIEYFPATVVLKSNKLENNGKVHSLRSGMSVTSLLKLGKRPAISMVSDKIGNFFDSSKAIR